ncbi:MAG TPA: DUF4142 domain-containing protein [Burkholderiales bacterium]|nr:DUF4142 domain-containing protein [Burkholderiales bacterium]
MNVFKLTVAAAVAAFLAFSQSGYAQTRPAAKVSPQDQQLMSRLAQGDHAEIAAGKLAAGKASEGPVKEFAEHMVTEHTRMLEEAKRFAQSKGARLPARADKKHQDALKKLQKLEGDAFDRAFMAQMVSDHKAAMSLAQKTAKDAKDPALRLYAQAGVDKIRQHLEKAQEIQASLSASAGGSARPAAKKK